MESASKDILLGSLVELLNDGEFKKDFVKKVNDHVDIPLINETINRYFTNLWFRIHRNPIIYVHDFNNQSNMDCRHNIGGCLLFHA